MLTNFNQILTSLDNVLIYFNESLSLLSFNIVSVKPPALQLKNDEVEIFALILEYVLRMSLEQRISTNLDEIQIFLENVPID